MNIQSRLARLEARYTQTGLNQHSNPVIIYSGQDDLDRKLQGLNPEKIVILLPDNHRD